MLIKSLLFVQYVDARYSMYISLISVRDTHSLLWCTANATLLGLVAQCYIGNTNSVGIYQVFFWTRKKMKLVVGLPN